MFVFFLRTWHNWIVTIFQYILIYLLFRNAVSQFRLIWINLIRNKFIKISENQEQATHFVTYYYLNIYLQISF